jgi:non-ribosomal peptide synthase protein (TIGR01720 family)
MQARRLEGLSAAPKRFNQTLLLRASGILDAEAMRVALGAVVAHHEALRLTFRHEAGAWRQSVCPDSHVSLDVVDLRGSSNAAVELAAHAGRLQGSHDPADGRLVAAAIYRQSDGDRLLISVHHFGIDAVSWRILLEDLERAYRAAQDGKPAELAPATGYLDWAAAHEAEVKTGARAKERAYWTDVMRADVPQIAVDDAGAPNRQADAVEISCRVEAAASAALTGAANSLYRTTPEELLIVALVRALDRWNGVHRLRIAIEGNGRGGRLGDLDISRTVGWFTVVYPVVLDLPADRDLGYQVRAIKEQLRSVPEEGAGFGQLRWMSGPRPDAELAGGIPILFNYLGRIGDAVARHGFSWDETAIGADVDGALSRHHEIDLSAAQIDDELRLTLRYGGRRLDGAKARRLLELWAEEASALADHLVREAVPRLTPSDLTYAGISLDDLERIVS